MEPSLVHQDGESPASRPASCSSPHQVSYQPPRRRNPNHAGKRFLQPLLYCGERWRSWTEIPHSSAKGAPQIPARDHPCAAAAAAAATAAAAAAAAACHYWGGGGGMFVYVCLVGFLFLCMQAFGSCLRLSLWVGENPRIPEEKIRGATSRKAGDEHTGRVWVAEERV